MATNAGENASIAPSLTQYINLANFVYNTGNSAYSVPYQIGYSPLSDCEVEKDGFYGESFISTGPSQSPDIIIAFEGTNIHKPPSPAFRDAELKDDLDIYNGVDSPSYTDAAIFTQKVINYATSKNIPINNLYVDGHSLGAAEAEYVAAKFNLAGTTFGAPGIPANDLVGSAKSKLTNYVDYGDPVGNYAANFPRPLGNVVKSGSIVHYGGQTYAGSLSSRHLLTHISQNYLNGSFFNKGVAAAEFTLGFLTHHQLKDYAAELPNTKNHVTLYGDDNSVGSDEGFYAALTGSSSKSLGTSLFAAIASPSMCFASGTYIRTTRGNVVVEELSTEDRVVTSSGEHRPIKWLGHRMVDCRHHPRPHEAMPVRIAAHAFGDDRPSRDLVVSPGHAICVDALSEVLIPAGALVNGSTIRQIDVDAVTYWHVELDSHDILLAENLPAESYLDMGNRDFFTEGTVVALAAAPDADPSQRTHADFCRPFVDGGPILEAIRMLLRQRAETIGWRATDALDMHLVVDGQRLDPVVRDLTARFHVPATAKDVWLMSPTAQPRHTLGGTDARDLGLYIGGLRVDDGFAVRDIAIDDPLLCIGFHAVEEGSRRWTAGRARLPTALWEGCEGGFYLRIDLAGRPVPRWTYPALEAGAAERPRLSIVA